MIFTKPIPYAAALDSRKVKALLPTELSSAELQAIRPALKELGSFSAKVTRFEILDAFDRLTESILNPQRVIRDGAVVTEGLNYVSARQHARDFLTSIGYQAPEGKAGTIQDLMSSRRIDLKLRTDVQMAQGFGYDQQGQAPELLDQWPAQELYRAIEPRNPAAKRNWLQRWLQAASYSGDGDAARVALDTGRLVARKDSPIWDALGSPELFSDGLGNRYAPFAFNSGMDVQDVDRDTAISLGIIEPNAKIEPHENDFNDLLKASPNIRSEALRAALLDDLGPDYEFTQEGVLRLK